MLLLIFIVGSFVVLSAVTVIRMNREIRRLEDALSWYKNWFRMRQGYVVTHGEYLIASFDCGKTWWNVNRDDNDPERRRFGFIIIDRASPKLLKAIDAFDELAGLGRTIDLTQVAGRSSHYLCYS